MSETARNYGQEVDVTLSGDSLQGWKEWLATQEKHEWLLTWAMSANKAAVTITLPLWMVARLISLPLSLLSLLTAGLLFWPFHWLLIRPGTFLVLLTSDMWAAMPVLRPLLLVLGPFLAVIGMVVVSLIPDGNPDHQGARLILCELWPLSRRRLEWIAEHGIGR